MKKTGIVIVAAALVLTIGAIGCGSDDSSESTTTAASITKDEFVTQGNEICSEGNKTIDGEAEKTFSKGEKPSKEQVLAFQSDVVLPTAEDMVAQMKALGIPAGDEDQVNAALEAADSAIASLQQDVDSGTVDKGNTFAETNKLLKAYGVECG